MEDEKFKLIGGNYNDSTFLCGIMEKVKVAVLWENEKEPLVRIRNGKNINIEVTLRSIIQDLIYYDEKQRR